MALASLEQRAVTAYTAILDGEGVILMTNISWEQRAQEESHPLLAGAFPGCNYLVICHERGVKLSEGQAAYQGMARVLAGEQSLFVQEYTAFLPDSPTFLLHVSALTGKRGAAVSHIETTPIRQREIDLFLECERVQTLLHEAQTRQQELIQHATRLEALVVTDGLTSLKNHWAFHEQLKREFERSARYGSELSLVLLDVDHFKQFNDSFGHPAGDTVLIRVAKLVTNLARETDFIARYGGEEYALILPNTEAEGALVLARRFRAAIEADSWQKRPVTASFGVATMTPTTTSPMQLLEEADEALYASKQAGRNCVHHYREIATGTQDPSS